MFHKTLFTCVWSGALVVFITPLSDAQTLRISVFNDAKVSARTLATAEANASRIFHQAGLETKWTDCRQSPSARQEDESCTEAQFPTHLHVRIVPQARTLASSTLGTSYLGEDETGCYSEVFFDAIASLPRNAGTAPGTILGQVMAHEIAHLLLGSNSHSASGIMRAQWQTGELRAAARGTLLFSSDEATSMRERISANIGDRVAKSDDAQRRPSASATVSLEPKLRTFRSPL
jgi:hypothetical protein